MFLITRHVLLSLFVLSLIIPASCQVKKEKTDNIYTCLPCGSGCDKETYAKPGSCPECHMELVDKSTINFKTIQPSEICAYITNHPNVVLLDVRTKEEFEGNGHPDFGTLKNAINIPVQELESNLATISGLKEKEIIVYCSHSRRSPRASYLLSRNGFTHITNMAGGMSLLKAGDCLK
jgi:rhodanese-related sulfurtransferase